MFAFKSNLPFGEKPLPKGSWKKYRNVILLYINVLGYRDFISNFLYDLFGDLKINFKFFFGVIQRFCENDFIVPILFTFQFILYLNKYKIFYYLTYCLFKDRIICVGNFGQLIYIELVFNVKECLGFNFDFFECKKKGLDVIFKTKEVYRFHDFILKMDIVTVFKLNIYLEVFRRQRFGENIVLVTFFSPLYLAKAFFLRSMIYKCHFGRKLQFKKKLRLNFLYAIKRKSISIFVIIPIYNKNKLQKPNMYIYKKDGVDFINYFKGINFEVMLGARNFEYLYEDLLKYYLKIDIAGLYLSTTYVLETSVEVLYVCHFLDYSDRFQVSIRDGNIITERIKRKYQKKLWIDTYYKNKNYYNNFIFRMFYDLKRNYIFFSKDYFYTYFFILITVEVYMKKFYYSQSYTMLLLPLKKIGTLINRYQYKYFYINYYLYKNMVQINLFEDFLNFLNGRLFNLDGKEKSNLKHKLILFEYNQYSKHGMSIYYYLFLKFKFWKFMFTGQASFFLEIFYNIIFSFIFESPFLFFVLNFFIFKACIKQNKNVYGLDFPGVDTYYIKKQELDFKEHEYGYEKFTGYFLRKLLTERVNIYYKRAI